MNTEISAYFFNKMYSLNDKNYSIKLSYFNTPILLDIDDREYMFNDNNQLIRIYEIEYFTKDEFKDDYAYELKNNEFYRVEDEIYPDPQSIFYPINKTFREDYSRINNFESVPSIKKYQVKSSNLTLRKYLEDLKLQRIKDLSNQSLISKEKVNHNQKVETVIIEQGNDLDDFLKNPPTRNLQNNIKLFKYFFNREPNDYETQLLDVHEPHFNVHDQIKKYQFKTYSQVPGGYIGDIFFNKSKFACLLLININTRKAYGDALNDVEIKPLSQTNDYGNREYTIVYSTTNKKTTINLIDAFKKFLKDINYKITSLRFDGESAIKSKMFQTLLQNYKIKFIPVIKDSHTSLGLIDRLCRTIRDISYNTRTKILTQKDIDKILNIYNNMYHSSLSKMLGKQSLRSKQSLSIKKITPNEVSKDPKLEQQIINYCMDYNNQLKVLYPEINLSIGQICKIYQPFDKFKKRRRLLKKDYFKIVNKTGNIYTVQNMRNNKKIDVPRYFIYNIY